MISVIRLGRWVLGLLLLSALVTGCSSTKSPKDWEAQIGMLTYDQALLELGPPNHVADLEGGGKVADWLQQSSRVYSSPGLAYGGWGPWMSGAYSPSVYSTPNVYLLMTFGPDLKLTSVRRQYK